MELGRVNKAVISYDAKHPVLLPREHWTSLLITRYYHQIGHSGVATTAAKIKKKYWIIRCHDLAKSVKFQCVDCRRIQAKVEQQFMSDLPITRLEPLTPPFHRTACDYFGPYHVKIDRSKQNDEALWRSLYLLEYPSRASGTRSRLLHNGISTNATQILRNTRTTSIDDL